MTWAGLLAIGIGATLGAWLRWALSAWLNPVLPLLPLGTLSANLVGGFLIGAAVEFLGQHANLAPEIRLFVITGFLGGLTTFSTFSAEAVDLLTRLHYGWTALLVVAHVVGSLLATMLGIATVRAISG
jgi:CrcB protein